MPVFDLKMKPGLETDPNLLNFTWNCVDFQSRYIDLKVDFFRYQYVSKREFKDMVEVYFNAP